MLTIFIIKIVNIIALSMPIARIPSHWHAKYNHVCEQDWVYVTAQLLIWPIMFLYKDYFFYCE